MIGAFVIGIVGSLHCVGMCGPMMVTFGRNSSNNFFLLYHSGRLLAYLAIGLFLSFIGFSISFLHFQQVATIILGLVLLIIYTFPKLKYSVEKYYYESWLYKKIKERLVHSFSKKNKWFISGVANGFLPCGLTYVAAAGAITQTNWMEGGLFMLLFGLGTVPALLVIHFGSNASFARLNKLLPQATTFIAILTGVILIIRGAMMSNPHFDQLVQQNAMNLISVCGF